jgi:hypothetical protein
MEITLVKSPYSGDPDMIQNKLTCKHPLIQGKELANAIPVKAINSLRSRISPFITATCTGAAM